MTFLVAVFLVPLYLAVLMPDEAARRLVPPWLEKLAAVGWRVLAVVALGLVLVAIAVELGTATAATLVALVLAAALAPTARRLRAARHVAHGGGRDHLSRGRRVSSWAARSLSSLALVPDAVAIVRRGQQGLAEVREQLVAVGAPELALRTFDRSARVARRPVRADLGTLAGSAVDDRHGARARHVPHVLPRPGRRPRLGMADALARSVERRR